MDSEPTPMPVAHQLASSASSAFTLANREPTSDEPATKDSAMPSRDCRRLYDYTYHKDGSVDKDSILAGDDLGQKAGVKATQPGAQLKDGRQPALLRLICCVASHPCQVVSAGFDQIEILLTFAESIHGQDTTEDALNFQVSRSFEAWALDSTRLIVPIEQTAQTCEACDTKDPSILDQSSRTRCAL